MIPLLFGIQQLTEGVIWLTFSHDAPLLKQTMTYLYSISPTAVADVIIEKLKSLKLSYPAVSKEHRQHLLEAKALFENERNR